MKKVIASILSLAFLSGIFVNPSFAEEIQPAEAAQGKASNVCDPKSQQDLSIVISDEVSKNETSSMETVNQPENLNKNNVNKKSDRENAIEPLKNNIKKYFMVGLLGSFIGGAIGGAIGRTFACNKILPHTKELVRKLLAALHPDSFPKKGQGKSFNDIKEVYYSLTNFYDTYLK